MSRRQVVGVLDVGTTKIVALLAEIGPNGQPIIKGFGECPTLGIRKGVVVDKTALSKSMARAMTLAKTMAGETVKAVYVSFPSYGSLTSELELTDEDLIQCVMLNDLDIKQVVVSTVAAAEAVLTETDRRLGTFFMDLGGTTTGLAVFDQGNLIYADSLPIGSEHITSDLAVCLRTTLGEAKRVKQELGLENPSPELDLEITGIGGQETRKVPVSTAVAVMQSRVQEILEMALQRVEHCYRLESLSGGVVLTGGGALLKGIINRVRSQLGLPQVKLGSVNNGGKLLPAEWTGPGYASSMGLLIYGTKRDSRRSENLFGWRGVLARRLK
ncbi:cell division protein FtsA [Desulforamulus ruminis]|uniref:Cell division protein FtsA n=1 Tax=Desulforamulus ruminis (strain ATCC 23193 / DSM 2154 / NCIMB 8452 / DL) TaxID=696281 RepID=F6DKC7_DESRL|nr:cell division FtsA domain-containing protein [Desulforamulus ruminis]AEG61544.1 cell division protein FtsA [Desulforamulus ruminis DSM 2154]